MKCNNCKTAKSRILRPKTNLPSCLECFYDCFENEIHQTIISTNIFKKGDRVCIGASGGKDSTVLAYVMNKLNKQHNYGLDLFLLSVDEGIKGYRDDSLDTVKQNQKDYGIPLKIVSYKELFGWTMDEIVKLIGLNNNCTFCGVFRRQALFKGALLLKADKVITGHNADDIAETVLMNILRGDYHRLIKSVDIVTGAEGDLPRVKPFKYTYEKEIVFYAHYKKLIYHSTECIYSPNAYRGHVRELIKELEAQRPSSIIDIIHSGENMKLNVDKENTSNKYNSKINKAKLQVKLDCIYCGFMTSNKICKACLLLDKLKRLKNKHIIAFEGSDETVTTLVNKEEKSIVKIQI